MKSYRFPCGCEFPILEERGEDSLPLLDFDIENVRRDCPATFKLLSSGRTKGVFQLESGIGKRWTKAMKPENEEHLGALGSLLRPGALFAVDAEGISMTEHYCRRKNGQEDIPPYHPVVDEVLKDNYNVMAYQEDAMALSMKVAGLTELQADQLRAAIGKKLANEMAKCKAMFIEGVEKTKVITKEQGEELFGWIEKSQKYLFNRSHAMSYGITGYDTAFLKTHFPVAFFAGWLANALHKSKPLDEISELINDAKLFDVTVLPPDLRMMSNHFQTDGKSIRFGIGDIKGIGDAQLKKLSAELEQTKKVFGKNVEDLSWTEFLISFANNLSSSVISKLIEVGALGWFGMSRLLMKEEYNVWNSLSPKEMEWVKQNKPSGNLRDILKALAKPKKEGGGCSNKNRVTAVLSQLHLLENPPSPLVDSPTLVAYNEEQLLGISITCNVIDSCDISAVNCSCKEFIAGREGYLMLGVEVKNVHECKTKKGKSPGSKMGRLVVTDGTCSLDAIAFPEIWKNHSDLFTPGNTIIVQGEHGKEQSELIVKKVWQANMA